MKLMRQSDAKEIISIAKAIYADGGESKGAERNRVVVLYGEDSKATRLFDYVSVNGELPAGFMTLDVHPEIKMAAIISASIFCLVILILFFTDEPQQMMDRVLRAAGIFLLLSAAMSVFIRAINKHPD